MDAVKAVGILCLVVITILLLLIRDYLSAALFVFFMIFALIPTRENDDRTS